MKRMMKEKQYNVEKTASLTWPLELIRDLQNKLKIVSVFLKWYSIISDIWQEGPLTRATLEIM
jgi:hypothetical protein